jgi:hypothetical protein
MRMVCECLRRSYEPCIVRATGISLPPAQHPLCADSGSRTIARGTLLANSGSHTRRLLRPGKRSISLATISATLPGWPPPTISIGSRLTGGEHVAADLEPERLRPRLVRDGGHHRRAPADSELVEHGPEPVQR